MVAIWVNLFQSTCRRIFKTTKPKNKTKITKSIKPNLKRKISPNEKQIKIWQQELEDRKLQNTRYYYKR